MLLKLSNIKIDCRKLKDADLKKISAEKLGISPEQVHSVKILSGSVDSRGRFPVMVYSLMLECPSAPAGGVWQEMDIPREPELELPDAPPQLKSAVVAGTGPAGIFGALALAMAGVKVKVLDRGRDVRQRLLDHERFLAGRELDEDSNLLIGEGGAGTFSDGKLYTGTKDRNRAFILKTYAEASGLPELRYLQRPHIGSDKLVLAAEFLRKRIEELGGEFVFSSEVKSLRISGGRCRGVVLAGGEYIESDAVLLAPGLGGRALAAELIRLGAQYELKGFQLGCRIEHEQSLIDRAMYHLPSRPEMLGAAEYHWSSHPKNALSAATFCMCPGGEIVMASAWKGHLTSNGMSYFRRDGRFANSALVTTVGPERFSDAAGAWEFIGSLEKRAFELGGGRYDFPAQDAAAFLRGENGLKNRLSSVRTGLVPGRIDLLLDAPHRAALCEALKYFERFCPGFIRYGKFVGQESCVSSPVRFLRSEKGSAAGIDNLFIGGEFAGYAGGIVSAAADGLKMASAMLSCR